MSIALAVLSGILTFLSYPSYRLWPLIFVALAPLLIALQAIGSEARPLGVRRAAALGWLAGLSFVCGAMWWVLPGIAQLQQTSLVAAAPFFVVFAAWHAAQWGLFAAGVVARNTTKAGLAYSFGDAIWLASWWVALEWGFPKILPWSAAFVLSDSEWLRQSADIGGLYLLTFIVGFVNATFAGLMSASFLGQSESIRWDSSAMLSAVSAVVLLVATSAYGAFRTTTIATSASDDSRDSFRIAIVQGGLETGRNDFPRVNEDAWSTYARLTHDEGTRNAGLVLWPETTLRVYLSDDPDYRARMRSLVSETNVPILVGSLDRPSTGTGVYNAAYLFSPPTRTLRVPAYHKRILLPFGEYVPGSALLSLVGTWHRTGEFVSGTSSATMTLVGQDREPLIVAPSICFEAIRPGFFNTPVNEGAQVLINITDDGWFGDTPAAAQHLQATVLRAVETRRWLVRASNSGISAFIDPTGKVQASVPLGQVGVLAGEVERLDGITQYARFGNWIVAVCGVVVCGGHLSRRRQKWASLESAG